MTSKNLCFPLTSETPVCSQAAAYGFATDGLRLAGFKVLAAVRKYFKVSFTESPSVSRATLIFQLHADSTA